jgi:hypothetical protein
MPFHIKASLATPHLTFQCVNGIIASLTEDWIDVGSTTWTDKVQDKAGRSAISDMVKATIQEKVSHQISSMTTFVRMARYHPSLRRCVGCAADDVPHGDPVLIVCCGRCKTDFVGVHMSLEQETLRVVFNCCSGDILVNVKRTAEGPVVTIEPWTRFIAKQKALEKFKLLVQRSGTVKAYKLKLKLKRKLNKRMAMLSAFATMLHLLRQSELRQRSRAVPW